MSLSLSPRWLFVSLVLAFFAPVSGWEEADDAFWEACMAAASHCRYEASLFGGRFNHESKRELTSTSSTSIRVRLRPTFTTVNDQYNIDFRTAFGQVRLGKAERTWGLSRWRFRSPAPKHLGLTRRLSQGKVVNIDSRVTLYEVQFGCEV